MKSGKGRSKRSKGKRTFCLPMVVLLLLSWTATVWGEHSEEKIKIVILRTTPNITMEIARQTAELIRYNIHEYSSVEAHLIVQSVDAGFFRHYDTSGDLHIRNKISRYECDYLLFLRTIDSDYLSAAVWSKDLILDQTYILYNEDMHNFLPDIAAGAFLSLLYQAESRFWVNKLY